MKKYSSVDRLYILRRLFAIEARKSEQNVTKVPNKSNVIGLKNLTLDSNEVA